MSDKTSMVQLNIDHSNVVVLNAAKNIAIRFNADATGIIVV